MVLYGGPAGRTHRERKPWTSRQQYPQLDVPILGPPSAPVMGFRWRPDGCAQVFYGPAGVCGAL